MIPLRLRVENFISYGTPQDIDFEPYGLICLSGKNGHGKSALLDALTWVLWGQARKASGTAKADEGLLHLGKTHMMVSLDFLCNGTLYRVKREFTLSAKSGQTHLEFGVLDKETGSFKALTDKTIRTTQAKITYTIGLDYEAFINSAFLRQGQSHEFSKKSPKERKDILAAILGLEHFERIRRLALDTAKEAQFDRDQAAIILERLEEELKEKPLVQERLISINEALTHTLEREKDLQAQYTIHKQSVAEIQSHKVATEKFSFKQEHLAHAIEEEHAQIRLQVRKWRDVARQQRKEGASPHLEQERLKIQEELSSLQILATKKVQLKEEFLIKKEHLRERSQKKHDEHRAAQELLDRTLHGLMLERTSAHQKKQDLSTRRSLILKECEILAQHLRILKESTLGVSDEILTTTEAKLERRKGFYHSFVSRAQTLKTALEDLAQKKQLISSSQQAQCPLCEQDTDKEKLSQKFSREEHLKAHQLSRLTSVCTSLKAVLREEHAALEGLKKQRENNQVAHAQLQELLKQHLKLTKEVELIDAEITTVHNALNSYEQRHKQLLADQKILAQQQTENAQDPLTKQLEQDIARLQAELEAVSYDPAKEQLLTLQLTALSQKSAQQSTFMKELALQDERRKMVHQKCDHVRTLKKQLAELTQTAPLNIQRSLTEAQLIDQEQLLAQSLAHLTKERESLIHQKGAFEAQTSALKQKEYVHKEQVQIVKERTALVDEYTALADAFSKDGIQALLIEDALPEIEEEANNLLARLTDNQAHISIDSLKDTKSGKTKETLDIKISDAVGVRPYEMFSGGEAFRIDFSLRVALSKLLARRAGTALQTLIIDEGFGSQDEDGLSHIMDALHSIREDFEKVIVVSHLPTLKEQFPVHFHVEKTPQGSVVNAIEHC